MVNSAKNILNKKNRLTCDHTTEEVLTTLINDYNNITNIYETWDIKKKKVSQIWCHDQDVELPHGEIV